MSLHKYSSQSTRKQKEESWEEIQKAAQIQALSPVDPKLELLDPNPNIHQQFQLFDKQFFWGKLLAVEVKWSPRMTQCAGICRYQTRSGFCTIGLSRPLLSLRPRKDLIETLLHEMIHAFLFVTHNNTDRDGHGPQFHKHMHRINNEIGSKISVYHTFHDEVRAQKVHVWRCRGPCKDRPPFYGHVRRSMNRAPGPHDLWHKEHLASCGGTFEKILEPPNFKSKKTKGKADTKTEAPEIPSTPKITSVFEKTTSPPEFKMPPNFRPFSGSGHTLGTGPSQSVPANRAPNRIIKGPTHSQDSKRKLNSSSPVKSQSSQSDISSFFTKSGLDISSDSDLLILSPPSKRKKGYSSTPEKPVQPAVVGDSVCPICFKSGFSDLNFHVNICLTKSQLLAEPKPFQSQKTLIVLDDSISDGPSTSKMKPRHCPICGKLISSDFRSHVNVCVASIPDDSDEEELLIIDTSDKSNKAGKTKSDKEMVGDKSNKAGKTKSDKEMVGDKSNKAGKTKSDKERTATKHDSSNSGSKKGVECPICLVEMEEILINAHLDTCLSPNDSFY